MKGSIHTLNFPDFGFDLRYLEPIWIGAKLAHVILKIWGGYWTNSESVLNTTLYGPGRLLYTDHG